MYEFEIRERADEDRAAASYNSLYHGFPITTYWDDDFFEFVEASYASGDRVLDLGCGPGSLWTRWEGLNTPRALVGVDLSEGMIEEARRRHPEGDFRVARAHELPFPDGSFDLVVCSAVLHHIPDDHMDGALREITRVLDEHGRLVGREPNQHPFGHEAGWFSGAIMSFRHLVFRLTHSREYPEPELGDHHHPFDAEPFLQQLGQALNVTRVEQRYPFSHYLLRARSDMVARFARMLDELLHDRSGVMFFYRADKNFVDAAEVRRVANLARNERSISDAEFLACLHEAAGRFDDLFSDGAGKP